MSTQYLNGSTTFIPINFSIVIQVLILIVVIACSTRFISGWNYSSEVSIDESTRRPAMIPYWVPYLGHLIPLTVNPSHFLQKCSQKSGNGVFALNLFGSKYQIVWTPSLINSIFENPALSVDKIRWSRLTNVFGAGRKRGKEYSNAHFDASACLQSELLKGSNLSQTAQSNALKSRIQEHVPSLVSFNESIIDQSDWERAAYVLVKPKYGHDSPSVEVSLFTLIRNFTGHAALPTIIGSEFLEAYPSTLDDLWDLDGGFRYLTLDLPRLLGIPSLTRAHIARRRLLNAMDSFHRALDQTAAGDESEQPWRDLSDVGGMMKERSAIWRKHGTSRAVKGPCDLSLLWAMSTKPTYLIFWMLIRVWASPGLVQQIRDEMGPFAQTTQPPQLFGIPELPRLKLDLDGLLHSCPLLKACFYEVMRLHSTPISVRTVARNVVVHEVKGSGPSYALDAGSIVAAPLGLHHHHPRYFESPTTFQPSRFLKSNKDEEGKKTVNERISRPWGVGKSACPGRVYAEQEILAFVAGILALWDFEPASNGEWVVPEQTERAIVCVPSTDIRVRLRPSQLS